MIFPKLQNMPVPDSGASSLVEELPRLVQHALLFLVLAFQTRSSLLLQPLFASQLLESEYLEALG